MSSASSWKRVIVNSLEPYARVVRERDANLGAFLEFDPARRPGAPEDGPLAGIPIAVKDNLAVRDFHLTCGSRIMGNHVSPYDATVVARLVAAGMIPVGKTNLDEFGMGSSTDNSALGVTNNPWDRSRVAGGSSGGSAVAVAAGLVPVALGTDTGGSVRQPAAFCGVYGLKPTYGRLSRYGLVAYASSLETVGIVGVETEMIRAVLHAAEGADPHDQTSIDPPGTRGNASGSGDNDKPFRRVAFLICDDVLDERTRAGYARMREAVKAAGIESAEIELTTAEVAVSSYYTIATAEASANLARFTGIRYGERPVYAENPEELVRTARSQGFGEEVLTRILLGTYVLRSGFQEQYYQRAQRIRTAVRNELQTVFDEHELLLLPAFPVAAFPHGDESMSPFQQKLADRFTSLANLTAVPALSIPAGVQDGLPIGIQVMGPVLSEERLLQFADLIGAEIPIELPPDYATPACELAAGGA